MRKFDIQSVPRPAQDNILSRKEIPEPVDLEIGAGVGLHAIQYCLKNPDRHLIAFERTKEKFAKFQRRYENHSLKNLYPIHGDAVPWISHYVLKETVDRCFILYPNPYPKKKHSNLRFAQMPFMSHLVEVLKPRGSLTLATNEEFYAQECAEEFVQTWGLELCDWQKWTDVNLARTHFEKKYLERGQTCHNLIFEVKDL